MNILLVCTAGMSTSYLVEKMKKNAQERGIEANINAVSEAIASEYVGKVDVVLLGPQVKFLETKMKELFQTTPVSVINMVDYGSMNGAKVLDSALNLITK